MIHRQHQARVACIAAVRDETAAMGAADRTAEAGDIVTATAADSAAVAACVDGGWRAANSG
jgi:hypothetical protein